VPTYLCTCVHTIRWVGTAHETNLWWIQNHRRFFSQQQKRWPIKNKVTIARSLHNTDNTTHEDMVTSLQRNTCTDDDFHIGDQVGNFHVGDHIKVIYRGSKHYGRTGTVSQVGNPRLTINFDDGRPGIFVDIKYARLTSTRQDNADVSEASQDDWISQVSKNDDNDKA
jgi:hypothetical protein